MPWRARRELALVLVLAAVSCSGPSTSTSQGSPRASRPVTALAVLEAEDAQTLDPALIDDPTSLTIGSEIFEGLTRLDARSRPGPGLAERWDVSDDGRTYTFHLRSTRYQSGAQVQAQDAVAVWTRALAPATASPLTGFMASLGGRHPGDQPAGVQALDQRTLRVRLPAPDSEFLTLLSMPPFWLYDPSKPGDPSAGSGPYRLDQWQRGAQLRLAANPNYWGGSPQVQSVTVNIEPDSNKRLDRFRRGEADIAHGFTGPQLLAFERDPGQAAELHRVRLARTTWLGFNSIAGSGYGAPQRMALAQAIDRGRLSDLAQFGSLLAAPATDLLPPGMPGHIDRSLPAYNPPSAKFALDQAGFPSRIDLYMSTNSTVGRVARELQAQIGDATGRTVALHPLGDFFTQASLDRLPLFIDTWSADVPYPADILESVIRTGAQFNNLRLSDSRVDAALDQGRKASSFDDALAAYQQAEQITLNDNRLIPLYSGVEPYLVRVGVQASFTGGLIPYRWEDVR